jgi:hypothetical protein
MRQVWADKSGSGPWRHRASTALPARDAVVGRPRPTNRSMPARVCRSALGSLIQSLQCHSVHWDAVLAQAAISGLFAVLRARHDADRSVGKVAAFLALPQ